MQSTTVRTFNIHFSHVVNSPIWVKRPTCQGKRRLDREIGKQRWNVDSRNQRLRWRWKNRQRRWKNRQRWRWKNRQRWRWRQDIGRRNQRLRDLERRNL